MASHSDAAPFPGPYNPHAFHVNACAALSQPFAQSHIPSSVLPSLPAWPPSAELASCDPPPMTSDACNLQAMSDRVAHATCYTKNHPQAIFYRRWNT